MSVREKARALTCSLVYAYTNTFSLSFLVFICHAHARTHTYQKTTCWLTHTYTHTGHRPKKKNSSTQRHMIALLRNLTHSNAYTHNTTRTHKHTHTRSIVKSKKKTMVYRSRSLLHLLSPGLCYNIGCSCLLLLPFGRRRRHLPLGLYCCRRCCLLLCMCVRDKERGGERVCVCV